MNIIFHASAGTGKTYQVTNLYVSLVLGRSYDVEAAGGKPRRIAAAGKPADPRRILLMTFTDAAAAELRTRVTQLILKARYEADAQGNDAVIQRTVEVLRALPSSPICTIHSFCASFLREHALEAGLSPGFAVLDETEAKALLDEVARDELLARLNRPRPGEGAGAYDPDFESFCQSEQRVLGGGEYATAVSDAATRLLAQAMSKGLDLRRAESMLPPPDTQVTVDDFRQVFEQMKKAKAERGGDLPGRAAEVFQALEEILRDFPSIGKTPVAGGVERLAEALAASGKTTFSGKNLKEISDRLSGLLDEALSCAHYRKQVREVRAFARYAAGVAEAYERRKRQLNVVDFDGLLVRTRDMLATTPPAARGALFDIVIVDEVQDTSRVQCEIIEKLWDPAINRLVICGDTKQSIYAWRNADPKVMPDLERAIAAAKSAVTVPLKASYRSKDRIIDFVNHLFSGVYGKAYTPDDQLVASPQKKALVGAQKEGPCIELLQAEWERPGSEDGSQVPEVEERVRREMTAVAERIRLLVDGPDAWRPRFRYSGEQEHFAPTGKDNAFRYSDILILLRRTRYQQVLEHALRQNGVPYRIAGRGSGLFARQEVKDALLFLKCLTHPFDTIALLGFLRSPWVGLSDEAVLQLGWNDGSFSERLLRERVLAETETDLARRLAGGIEAERQVQRVLLARELLAAFRAQTSCRLASDLVRELIQRTGYDAVIAGTFRGGQHLANLRRLIDWLRAAERGGTVLLADVVKALEANADNPPDIPEAVLLDPEENVVSVMTVHGAKGLTARVVFVPEISAQPPADQGWAFIDAPEHGNGSAILHVKTEDLARNEAATPGFGKARDRAKEVRQAESKNIFYVAMTRARDLVVASGPPGTRRAADWRAQFDTALAGLENAALLVRPIGFDKVRQAAAQLAPPAPAGAHPPHARVFDAAAAACSRPPRAPLTLRFTATALSAFHADPEAFSRAPLTGAAARAEPRRAPTEAEPAGADAAAPADTDESGASAAFGTAGHAVLEHLALAGWTGDINALAAAEAKANGLGADAANDLQSRVARVAAEMARAAGAAGELLVEWPFALALKQDTVALIVDGTADVILRGAAGGWRILDYKFSEEPREVLARKYGLQLNLYREALRRRLKAEGSAIEMTLVAVRRQAVEWIDVAADPSWAAAALAAAETLDRLSRGLSG